MNAEARAEITDKARSARAGTCILCGCDAASPCHLILSTEDRGQIASRECSWVSGSGFRICDGHKSHEIAEASAALRRVAEEAAHAA